MMTDLHCHMLYGVDDGAESVEETFKMLDIAYSDGIRTICFTPHFKAHHFNNGSDVDLYNEKIRIAFKAASDYAAEHYSDMRLFLGNEIMHHHDIYASLNLKNCSYLGNSSYLLVEFVPSAPFFEIQSALSNLLRKGVRPVLAHVERYEELAKDASRVKELRDMGALIQVNASSVTRLKFGKSARFIKTLFKKSLVDIIATDAHSSTKHRPVMSEAVKIIGKKYGEKTAKSVSDTTPNMILENKRIH